MARYYGGHQDALLLAGWIGLLGFPLAFGFIAGLAVLLHSDGKVSAWLSAIAVVSIAVTLAVATVQGILALAVPYVATSVGGEQLKILADVTQLGFSASFVPEVGYFVASGVLVLRSRTLPRWLGYGAFVVAVVALVASLGALARSGPLVAGGPATLVALVASLLWWLLVAILLVIRPRTA